MKRAGARCRRASHPRHAASYQWHVVHEGTDQPLWGYDRNLDVSYYYELDTLGNVRRLHGIESYSDASEDVAGDLGGYAYTAFGRLLESGEPGFVEPPRFRRQAFGQLLRWQARPSLEPWTGADLYDFRARTWSPALATFLQPDELVFLHRSGTLWSWPGQNPYRWRDPGGRYPPAPGGAFAGLEGAGVVVRDIVAGVPYPGLRGLLSRSAVAAGPLGAALLTAESLALFADQVDALGAEVFARENANLDAIARAAQRDNSGKPDPGTRCQTESGGAGAKKPPGAEVSAAAADEEPEGGAGGGKSLIGRSQAAGGHLIARHVGLDAATLDARIAAGRINVASSFSSLAEAEAAAVSTLGRNASTISAWVKAGAPGRLTVSAPFSGGLVRVAGGYSADATGASFVLQGSGAGAYYILTGFPVP